MRRVAMLSVFLAGCAFNPDLSRFPLCTGAGECPAGSSCLTEEQRCVPRCGESCTEEDSGVDAGTADAGNDAGLDAGEDGGSDGGEDAGSDAGPVLALAAATLPAALETQPYGYTFVATGGEGAYSFSIDGGVPGFTLSTTGELSTSAAPTPGNFPFAITVRDDAVPRGEVTTPFTLEVRPFLRVASKAPLVEGRQGQPYVEQLSATGGVPPYRWVVDGGMLPAGLSLTADGGFLGNPSALGTATFGVTVADSAAPPQQASRSLTIEVKTLDTLLTIATGGAADGRVGTAYSLRLKAYGGTQPYSWSVLSGNPPPGVTLTNTGTVGELSGTPTMAGTFNFTLRCADTLTSQNQALSITVY